MTDGPPNVDELLASPLTALDLPAGSLAVHAVVLVTYLEPASEVAPRRTRLAYAVDDALSPWGSLGMLLYAARMEEGQARLGGDES